MWKIGVRRLFQYKNINFRSEIEAEYAKWLDQSGLTWFYEPTTYRLSDGSKFTPDFFVNEWNMFVTIQRQHSDNKHAQMTRFLDEYKNLDLKIMYEDEALQIIRS